MIATHSVKKSGRWYYAGEDIEKRAEEEMNLPFSDSEIELETQKEERTYTKTEINRMTTAELQNLAAEVGIENAFETSGSELKKILANRFGL